MKSIKKGLLTLGCAALLVSASVMGTMAYLTSTDTVTNTFTVGKVAITLDEAWVNDAGKAINENKVEVDDLADAKRVDGNSYKLMPGHQYVKDPTLTVNAGSEASYVRLLVTATFGKGLTNDQLATKLDGIFTGYSGDWVRNGDPVATTVGEGEEAHTVVTYEYRYKEVVPATSTDTKLDALFTGITVPGTWTNDDLANIGGFTISVVGQAIQADGFGSNEDEAWAEFPTTTVTE